MDRSERLYLLEGNRVDEVRQKQPPRIWGARDSESEEEEG